MRRRDPIDVDAVGGWVLTVLAVVLIVVLAVRYAP